MKNIKSKGKSMSLSAMYNLGEDDSEEELLSEEEGESGSSEDEDFGGASGEEIDEDGDEDEDEDEDEDIEMTSDEGDEMQTTVERLKDDLFADDDDDSPQSGAHLLTIHFVSLPKIP